MRPSGRVVGYVTKSGVRTIWGNRPPGLRRPYGLPRTSGYRTISQKEKITLETRLFFSSLHRMSLPTQMILPLIFFFREFFFPPASNEKENLAAGLGRLFTASWALTSV